MGSQFARDRAQARRKKASSSMARARDGGCAVPVRRGSSLIIAHRAGLRRVRRWLRRGTWMMILLRSMAARHGVSGLQRHHRGSHFSEVKYSRADPHAPRMLRTPGCGILAVCRSSSAIDPGRRRKGWRHSLKVIRMLVRQLLVEARKGNHDDDRGSSHRGGEGRACGRRSFQPKHGLNQLFPRRIAKPGLGGKHRQFAGLPAIAARASRSWRTRSACGPLRPVQAGGASWVGYP